jgi:hypothetical protein
MILSFKVYLALRTQMSIHSSGTNVFLLGTGVEPAMEMFGAGNSFERIQSKESGFQGANIIVTSTSTVAQATRCTKANPRPGVSKVLLLWTE